ncbi:MAG: hypothetical protein D6690_10085 [Nitrospirae bacterium]|nr:MAG: hypothetical protein D6690_10085 [Nitrospirota bacterium]
MSTKATLIGTLAVAVLAVSLVSAAAETAKEKAINAGAKQLTAEEIADLLVGKTVTARAGEKKFLFHYSRDNVLSGKLIGGGWSDTGYYGITDDNRVCLSMSKDKGRLRCLTLLREQDSTVKKYNVDGDMTFELLEFQEGKAF